MPENKIQWKPLLLSLLLSLGTGALSSLFTRNSMPVYEMLEKPPLAPPPMVFPIVWTILFILMGIAAYRIYRSSSPLKRPALVLYVVNLAVNFFWPLLFFGLQAYLLAFIWLLLLWVIIIALLVVFRQIDRLAAWLLVPYFLWVSFAGYLNLGIYLLNR